MIHFQSKLDWAGRSYVVDAKETSQMGVKFVEYTCVIVVRMLLIIFRLMQLCLRWYLNNLRDWMNAVSCYLQDTRQWANFILDCVNFTLRLVSRIWFQLLKILCSCTWKVRFPHSPNQNGLEGMMLQPSLKERYGFSCEIRSDAFRRTNKVNIYYIIF